MMRAPDEVAPKVAAWFRYSEAEWSEIEASVRALTNRELSNWRALLEGEGECYRAWNAEAWRVSKARARRLKIANKINKLLTTLGSFLSEEGPSLTPQLIQIVESWNEIRSIMGRITALNAEIMALLSAGELQNPRLFYQCAVLSAWHFLGGKLALSRNRSGEITGPLARFFFAAVRPVMGASAPALESLPDIVDRQKVIVEKFLASAANPDGRENGGGPLDFWSVSSP